MTELKMELKKHRGRRPVETFFGDASGSISDHHNNETISIKGVTHFSVQVMFTLKRCMQYYALKMHIL